MSERDESAILAVKNFAPRGVCICLYTTDANGDVQHHGTCRYDQRGIPTDTIPDEYKDATPP
jgi:hypothetical protein